MAAVRYTSKFTDEQGDTFAVEIVDADYGGSSPFEFTLGADGFTLNYETTPQDRFQAVMGSTLEFSMHAQNANDAALVANIAGSVEGRYTVKVTRDPDGTPSLFWSGTILAEQVTIADDYFPQEIRLTASDDLGNLANIEYNDDGTAYTGKDYIYRHLLKALKKTRHFDNYGTTAAVLKWANNFYESSTTTTADHLATIGILHSAWYNVEGGTIESYATAFEVVENIARAFNARLFQHEGAFWFVPVQLYAAFTSASNSLTVESCKADGTKLTQTTQATKYTDGTDGYRKAGNALTYMRPLSSVRKTWDTAGDVEVLELVQYLNPITSGVVFPQVGFGAVSDVGISYASGQQVGIFADVRFAWELAASTAFGIPFLRLEIKCGSQYYTNSITWGATTQIIGADGPTGFSYTNHTIGSASWSGTAGYYYVSLTSTAYNLAVGPQGGEFIQKLHNLLTAGLPSDQDTLTITPAIVGYNSSGTGTVTNFTSASAYARVQLRAFLASEGDAAPLSITHEAINDAAVGMAVQEQTLRIGSSGYTGTRGQLIDGAPGSGLQAFTDFKTITDGTIAATDILTLGCREIMSGQRKPVAMRRGDFYGAFIGPLHWVLVGTDGYLPASISYTANLRTAQVEMFEIQADNTDITTPTIQGEFGDNTLTGIGGVDEIDAGKLVDITVGTGGVQGGVDDGEILQIFLNG